MRDYIIGKHRVLKGTGDPQEAKAIEYFKKLIEAEKQVDRDRKDQRIEKKLMIAKEQEEKERMKLKKRQERMAKLEKPENPTKPYNQRSEKPEIQRINRNVSRYLTQDELDF
jgi:hypothetical protein